MTSRRELYDSGVYAVSRWLYVPGDLFKLARDIDRFQFRPISETE